MAWYARREFGPLLLRAQHTSDSHLLCTHAPPTQVAFGYILQHGGNWYMSVPNENAENAALGCYIGAAIYAVYICVCGSRVLRLSSKKKDGSEALLDHHEY